MSNPIIDTLVQAGTGGILGAVSAIGTGVVSIFQSKAQFAHDEAMAVHNLELTRVQGELAQKIEDAKFKTYGCGSAIASSSLVTEWVRGRTLDEALAIKNADIAEELCLPPVKIHCSILAEDAIKAAVADFRSRHPAPGGGTLVSEQLACASSKP